MRARKRTRCLWILLLLAAGDGTLSAVEAAESVTLTGQGGFPLHGRYYAAQGYAAGVLLVHQCDRTGELTGYEGLARKLEALGLHVLDLDLRGYGRSNSEAFPRSSWPESPHSADVVAAFDFLASREEVRGDAMAVVGASCGGRHALLLAEQRSAVSSLVLISSAIHGASAAAAQRLSSRALFCVLGADDPYGSVVRSTLAAFDASTNPASRLVMYRSTAHGTPLFEHDHALVDTVARWLASRLDVPPRVGVSRSLGEGQSRFPPGR